ncbi:hypothetical protein ZWY2020_049609 [Hordeum vulgare]|nr:hypothetical protein ZWY2020_005839 [Hordeum vulgare]KAI4976002.1 hypothetical protein ZWY2020_049609 [Hordeum vulgare]
MISPYRARRLACLQAGRPRRFPATGALSPCACRAPGGPYRPVVREEAATGSLDPAARNGRRAHPVRPPGRDHGRDEVASTKTPSASRISPARDAERVVTAHRVRPLPRNMAADDRSRGFPRCVDGGPAGTWNQPDQPAEASPIEMPQCGAFICACMAAGRYNPPSYM